MKTKFKNLDSELQGLFLEVESDIESRKTLINSLREQGVEIDDNATTSQLIGAIVENGGLSGGGSSAPSLPSYPPMSDGYIPTGKKYGIKIDKNNSNPATRIEYIEDAVGMTPAKMNYVTGVFEYGSWADVWFVKNNYPVMLKFDGTEDYKLSPNDYSKKLDGTSSDNNNINYQGNAMSRIPLVYLKMYQDATHEYILVSDVKHDDTWNAYAHTDENGNIKESLYLSIYKGSLDSSSRLRSISSQALKHSLTAQQEIDASKRNGSRYNTRSWSQRNLINMLLLIIGKNDDTQAVFGQGNVSSTATIGTGSLINKGQFFGYNTQTQQVKVFHIEGWWGDIWERIQGLIYTNGVAKVKMAPPYNLTGDGYENFGISGINSGGYIKDNLVNQYGRLGNTFTGGSSTTYTPDYVHYNSTGGPFIALVGGSWGDTSSSGAFYVYLLRLASSTYTYIGAGLVVL